MPDQAPDRQAREFAAAFRGFLDWVHATVAEDNEVSALVRDFLGPGGSHHSVVTRELPPFEHVNLQTAVDGWSVRAGRTAEIRTLLGVGVDPADLPVGGALSAGAGPGRGGWTAYRRGMPRRRGQYGG
jgi:hypothetical protein